MVHANLLARLGRVFVPRVPLVCTIHNVTEGARWREIAYRLTDRLATRTTAVSETAAKRYVAVGAVPPGRVNYLPNGYDFSAKLPTEDSIAIRQQLGIGDEFLWLTAGRLHQQKGYDLLLDAFDRLLRDVPNVRLAIAGDGPEAAALRAQLARLDLGGAVTMLGDREDVPALLAAADGFVLSSRWEGLPVVLLEAAAAQLPIVATDVGGNSEVVVPKLGGVLTDVSAAAIATGMAQVVGLSPAARLDVGRALRDQARARFDLPGILERWQELYDGLVPTPREQ
jgi:glycosyltransferase involved in cell wall biosynthesis